MFLEFSLEISESNQDNMSAWAHIYTEHGYPGDLIVDLGVGDPIQPYWSVNVWNREVGEGVDLDLTINVSGAESYLPPSEGNRWFLKVSDAGNGNQGQITSFSITDNGQVYDSTCIPVAINDFQTSYSYIPGVPVELAISRRISIRAFPDTDNYTVPEVSWELLSKVLWAGYGSSSIGRTVPNICGNYPLIIYVCNKTAVYRYNPEEQSLDQWKSGDHRFSSNEPWVYPGTGAHFAPIELFIALDTNKFADINLGAMEAGAVIQNIYLEANALGLGTVCVGGVNKTGAHEFLSLPANEEILYNMPLGHPATWAFYNFTCVAPPGSTEWPFLPQVKQSPIFLDDALMQRRTSHEWKETPLTSQETSQILWSYGLSYLEDMHRQIQPRTVASAEGGYAWIIWMINSTGIYVYDPWSHRILIQSYGDKRAEIAQSARADWMASAPMILLLVLNSGLMPEGRLDWAFTEAGSVIQNVNLESVAWGLVADWSTTVDENTTRAVLEIAGQTDLRPIAAIAVGHSPRSDVAVTSIVSDKQTVIQGQQVTINATVANQGSQNETFNVTAYANTVQIGKRTINNLGPGAVQTIAFSWNTIGLGKGSYTVWAYADPVPGESDIADNNRSCFVTVTSTLDITGPNGYPDGKVDMRDISYVARRFMCKPGDSLWDSKADLNGDSKIDMRDIAIGAKYFGEHYP
jgi:nitroreductase